MPIVRRPYHAGSLPGPAPTQDLTDQQRVDWLTRIRAYWNRGNAMAGAVGRALLSFLGSDGALFPSMKSIATVAKCHPKTVQRWIDDFAAVGFIERITRRTPLGQTSNAYRIRLPDPEAPAADPAPLGEQLSIYTNQEEEDGAQLSMDSLPRPAASGIGRALARLFGDPKPAPQPPLRTVAEQIALLMLQGRLALE